jgi:glycosyltransferase involved in cell wall biosynthesis
MVVLETLACGRPVIGSRVGGIPDVIEHRRNGLLVEPGDRNELREAIEQIVRDQELRTSLTAGATIKAMDYRASSVLPRVERAYERVRDARLRPIASARWTPSSRARIRHFPYGGRVRRDDGL